MASISTRAPERVTTSQSARSLSTTTIRVSVTARDELRSLAAAEHVSVGEVVDRLLQAEADDRFWAEMKAADEQLRADPRVWAEYQAEIELLDAASLTDFQEFAAEGNV